LLAQWHASQCYILMADGKWGKEEDKKDKQDNRGKNMKRGNFLTTDDADFTDAINAEDLERKP
jgi:hypothetical protein